jgi:proteasome accessory factor B
MPGKKKKIPRGIPHSRPPLNRMMHLHEELLRERYPNCRKLGEVLEVSGKTIQRDLEFMRDQLGLPIEYHPQRFGYFYAEPVKSFPTLQVSEGELLAVFVARKALEQYRGTTFERSLRAAFDKLARNLDGQVSFGIEEWEEAISFRPVGSSAADLEVFEALAKSVRRSQEVEFGYAKLRGSGKERRRLQPYHLACVENQWYVMGLDLDRRGLRTFALPRVDSVQLKEARFRRPAHFSPRKLLAGSFGIMSGQGSYRIRLKFKGMASKLVPEKTWHPTQRLQTLPDGAVEMTLQLSNLPEIQRWILSWGSEVEVLEPAELAERIRREASLVAGT